MGCEPRNRLPVENTAEWHIMACGGAVMNEVGTWVLPIGERDSEEEEP